MVLRCEWVILNKPAFWLSLTYLAVLNLGSRRNLSRADDAMQGLSKHCGSVVDFLEQLVSVLLVAVALVTEVDYLNLKVVVLVIS